MKHFAATAHPSADAALLSHQKVTRRLRSVAHGRPQFGPFTILFGLLALTMLFYVWTRVEVVQLGYDISTALKRKEAAIIARNQLKIEIATISSAQRLERIAGDKLGLYIPRKDQIVIMR
jgi:cell division protein FtsL